LRIRTFLPFIFLALGLIFFTALGCAKKQAQAPLPKTPKQSQPFAIPQPRLNPLLLGRISKQGFPRLMNELQICCRKAENEEVFQQIFYWDLLILDPETMHNFPEYFGKDGIIWSRNPNTIILATFSGGDAILNYKQPIVSGFNNGLKPEWFLLDVKGKKVPMYHLKSGYWTYALNPTTEVNSYMPNYLEQNVIQTNAVDGIFYDWATTSISWINHHPPKGTAPIDIDADGKEDSDRKVDRLWREGYMTMLSNSRKIYPEGTLIVGNGGWNNGDEFSVMLNGLMIEQFLGGANALPKSFGWGPIMRTYASYEMKSLEPRMSIIMANDDDANNTKKMRFALASVLMFDGYFCFTNRTGAYRSARWYDEYSVDAQSGRAEKKLELKGYLGRPLGAAFNVEKSAERLQDVLFSKPTKASSETWRRDFENGIVLVNPDDEPRTIKLNGSFRKISGKTDPVFNDGSVVTEISLPPNSGAILLRAASEIKPQVQ
jgi:hypothetical protein